MHRNVKVALGGAALSLGVVVGMPTAALGQEIDCTIAEIAAKYPERCVQTSPTTPPSTPPSIPVTGGEQAPGQGSGGGSTGGGTAGGSTGGTGGGAGAGQVVSSGRAAADTLPFTGDEILVLSIAGAAALAAGTALTVAGRRRRTTTA